MSLLATHDVPCHLLCPLATVTRPPRPAASASSMRVSASYSSGSAKVSAVPELLARAVLEQGEHGGTVTLGCEEVIVPPALSPPCPHVPADAVDVGLDGGRHVKVDDSSDVLEVNAAGDTVFWVLRFAGGGQDRGHGDI